eukprot:RCo052947
MPQPIIPSPLGASAASQEGRSSCGEGESPIHVSKVLLVRSHADPSNSGTPTLCMAPTPSQATPVVMPQKPPHRHHSMASGVSSLRNTVEAGSTATGSCDGSPGSRRLRWARRHLCTLTLFVMVVVPLAYAVSCVVVGALIGVAGHSSAETLANQALENAMQEVIADVAGTARGLLMQLLIVANCMRDGCVSDFLHVLQLLVVDFQVSKARAPSLLTVASWQNDNSLLPLGVGGEVIFRSSAPGSALVGVMNRTACGDAGSGMPPCPTPAVYSLNSSRLVPTSTSSSGLSNLTGDNFERYLLASGRLQQQLLNLTLEAGSPVNVVTLLELADGTVQLAAGFAVPVFSEGPNPALTALVSGFMLTTKISMMLPSVGVLREAMLVIVTRDGSLLAASVDPSVQNFWSYATTTSPWFTMMDLTAVPIIASGGRHLMDWYHGDLGSLRTSEVQMFRYGGSRGILTASPLNLGLQDLSSTQVPLYVVVFVPYSVIYGQLLRGVLVAGLIGLAEVIAAALLVLSFSMACFVRPLRRLTRALTRLRTLKFDLYSDKMVSLSLFTEIRDMQVTTRSLEEALSAFGKYLPHTVVRILLKNNKFHHLGMKPVEVAIHFSDIVNFTGISEGLSHIQLIDIVGEYLQEMSMIIVSTGGTIDKFIGDAIMSFWNAPDPVPQYSSCAVEAAVR